MELHCGTCTREITGQYFRARDRALCDACRHRYELEIGDRPALGHFLRAGGFGLLAALGGAALWGGVIWWTGYELGLIAVLVGLMVGAAVKVGSGGLGGRGYQLMAVALTYLAVSLAYVPLVLGGMAGSFEELEQAALGEPGAEGGSLLAALEIQPAAAEFLPEEPALTEGQRVVGPFAVEAGVTNSELVLAGLFVLGLAAAVPFLSGFENAIGVLIIGFALFEAWRMNQKVDLSVSGPFDVSGPVAVDGPVELDG